MTVTPAHVAAALIRLRLDYLETEDRPMRGTGGGLFPAEAVTRFNSAPDVHAKLAAILNDLEDERMAQLMRSLDD